MPDGKLTDNEIVKAVKSHEEKLLSNGLKCLEPFEVRDIVEQQQEEINRQKAEIERLRNNPTLPKSGFINLLCGALIYTETLEQYNKFRQTFKAEAYKEFTKRLNNKGMFPHEINDDYAVGLETIDKLLKELVGENDAR